MRIKILPEDTICSKYIRKRDGRCVRCGSKVEFNANGDPVSHQASHFWSRGNWATRFDPDNVDTLCFGCHQMWGGDYRRDYEAFKINQLGKKAFIKLEQKAHSYANKLKERASAKAFYKVEYPKLHSNSYWKGHFKNNE